MSTLLLKDCKGKKLGEVTLSEKFAVSDKGAQAVHQAVITHQAHQHQGSANTQRKGEVAGSGKKPWKQKGLGRARAGYRQSPVWRGGGVAFGPHPRKVRKQVPRKVARLAFARAFGERAEAGQVMVLDAIQLTAPRTKEMCSLLQALEIKGKTLLILDTLDANIALAARNLQDIEVVCASNVNTYQIVRYPQIVITKAGVEQLEQRMA
ncbi:MAG: 50S ribosomal protein L4 [Kiritimatiellales bacterium]